MFDRRNSNRVHVGTEDRDGSVMLSGNVSVVVSVRLYFLMQVTTDPLVPCGITNSLVVLRVMLTPPETP